MKISFLETKSGEEEFFEKELRRRRLRPREMYERLRFQTCMDGVGHRLVREGALPRRGKVHFWPFDEWEVTAG